MKQFGAGRHTVAVRICALHTLPKDVTVERSKTMEIAAGRCPAFLIPLLLFFAPAQAQKIPFDFQAYPSSPVVFVNSGPGTFREVTGRRMFVTVKNASDKMAIGLVFEQDLLNGDKRDILTLERVSVIVRSGESKRLSISVEDVWNRIQAAEKSGTAIGKPVVRIVVVEFVEGGLWSAPLDRYAK